MKPVPLVVDASVLVPLLLPEQGDEDDGGLGAALRDEAIDVVAPPWIDLEVLNVGARRRRLGEAELQLLAAALEGLPINRFEPVLGDVARWSAKGLSAYDASYVALAEEIDARLLTRDADILALLPERATDDVSR